MSLQDQFKTNKILETEGINIAYGPNEDGSIPTFRISRMHKSNKKYMKALTKATRPYRRAIELETMNEELAESVFLDVFCKTILLGWENIQDQNGVNMVFSLVNSIALFTNLPELYEDLQENAKKVAMFRDEELESDVGN